MEVRRIWTSTELVGYLDFPYAAQVFAVQRDTRNLVSGKFRRETVYGLTSLSPRQVWIPGHDDGDSRMIVMTVPK